MRKELANYIRNINVSWFKLINEDDKIKFSDKVESNILLLLLYLVCNL